MSETTSTDATPTQPDRPRPDNGKGRAAEPITPVPVRLMPAEIARTVNPHPNVVRQGPTQRGYEILMVGSEDKVIGSLFEPASEGGQYEWSDLPIAQTIAPKDGPLHHTVPVSVQPSTWQSKDPADVGTATLLTFEDGSTAAIQKSLGTGAVFWVPRSAAAATSTYEDDVD